MNNKIGPYQVVDLSASRRGMAAYLELKGGRHCMYALLEADVTLAKRYIAEHKAQTGESLSFTGYLIYCLACAESVTIPFCILERIPIADVA